MLRSFGWLSCDDLLTRKGGVGPTVPVPGGQSPGEHDFAFSVIPLQDNLRPAKVQAEAFLNGMIAARSRVHAGSLPHSASFLQVAPADQFAITTLKPPEEGQGIIVRGVNLDDTPVDVALTSLWHLRAASRIRLAEVDLEPFDVDGRRLTFRAEAHEIATLRLIFDNYGSSRPVWGSAPPASTGRLGLEFRPLHAE